uniref:(northern house mosquito) hypothetical protein n=1 Tax=Culex pipiens TaxID=7175 RepID=A0A8D8BJ72_CULPI
MGQAGPGGVLHRAVVRGGRPGHRLWPPSAHAAVEQHLPVDGQSGDHHAAALPDQRDPAQVQEAPQLPVGAEPHGEELPAGDGGRPEAKLGQLCHLLGEDGDGPEAALLAFVSQLLSSVVARAGHELPDLSAGAERAPEQQQHSAERDPH